MFWRQFVKTRNRNVTFRDARSFRYPAEMHDFGFALAFLSKSGATYRFLEETLLGTLPGRRYTLHRRLQKADVLIEPGYSLARIHAARSFYQRLGYTAGVFVTSSDATAVRQELTVRLADDALHGLCTLRAVMTGDTLQEMQALAEEHGLARQVDVLLLNPLDTRLPSFVLGVFPQRATPSAAILRERWELLRPLLAAVGLVVVGHCADGDPPQLSCMLARRRAALEGDKAFSFLRVPSITGGTFHVSAQARPAALPQLGVTEALLVPDLDFQDEVHGALKRRGRVLNRDGIGVWLGDGVATLRTLQEALDHASSARLEINLGVRKSDLNPTDRMNFPAVERLLNPDVREFLRLLPPAPPSAPPAPEAAEKEQPPTAEEKESNSKKRKKKAAGSKKKKCSLVRPAPSARHLAAYLEFSANALAAFLGQGTPAQRLYSIWFARYFADGWRAWLVANNISLGDNFISSNQYNGIVLNSESLLLFYHWLCSHPALRQVPASAFAFGTQQSENNFRDMRSGQDSTLSVGGMLHRQTLGQEFALVRALRAALFSFPQHHKHTHADSIRREPQFLPADFTETEVRRVLQQALDDAIASLRLLGIVVPAAEPSLPAMTALSDASDLDDAAVDANHALIEDVEGDGRPSTDEEDELAAFLDAQADPPMGADALGEGDLDEASAGSAAADEETASHGAAALCLLGRTADPYLHFAERTAIVRRPGKARLTVVDQETGQAIHKTKAVALCGGHRKQSADRLVRVRADKSAKSGEEK